MTKKNTRRSLSRDEEEFENIEFIKGQVRKRLQETGDLERLRNYLSWRLNVSGWKADMLDELKGVVKEKGRNVTVQNLYDRIAARGRASIDKRVMNDMMRKIRYCSMQAICNNNNEDFEDSNEDYAHDDYNVPRK